MAGKKKTKSIESPRASAEEAAAGIKSEKIKAVQKSISMSQRSGVVLPCARVLRYLKGGNYARHIQKGAAIYCAASLEYLVAEVLEMAGEACKENKKKRINPRHLCLAIRNDLELKELCQKVVISQGGVVPFVHNSLLPKKTTTKHKVVSGPVISESYESTI